MLYQLIHKMALEMGFVVFALWIAMMALGKGQILFRRAVIGGLLLFGLVSYLGMHDFAIALQLATLCLLLLGWICKVRWQIKHPQSERDG